MVISGAEVGAPSATLFLHPFHARLLRFLYPRTLLFLVFAIRLFTDKIDTLQQILALLGESDSPSSISYLAPLPPSRPPEYRLGVVLPVLLL